MNRLQALHDAGVSIWLDSLSRELLDSGELQTLIADCAVTGATSNPTIFAKAITGSARYDDQLRRAVASGADDLQELFFQLALDDVGRAADLLLAAHHAGHGRDGFVSFECTPDLADDTAATIEQALQLWRRLGRPNVMVKVPYGRYRERFSAERWLALERAGARPQRPLWASTGTKDPAYSDVLYVERLIAPEAINTMPAATLRAFADHGDARALDWDARADEETLRAAAEAGVDLDLVTAELERDGVRSFCDSYHELLGCIEAKLATSRRLCAHQLVRGDR